MTSANAAEIAISGMPKESIPAAFGGELHGENTSTVEVDGKGTLTATINYDTGVVTVKDFNGAVRTESLAAVVANAANELEKIPAEQTSGTYEQGTVEDYAA